MFSLIVATAQNSSIFGKIRDGESEAANPLGFANVGISALNLGATTDMDGNYRILNVPVGKHKLQISYVGYETHEVEISVYADKATEFNHTLLPSEGSNLGEVVIAAQAIGQMAAINQQINSNTIVNVISKEKLQELPDQNAAEALGRLAGVAIQRDGGEGQKVVLRGLSPRLNSITVNGERIPSTDGDDRSVDLSMVSPDMLAGVEFYKANRPDMDGDAIGGSVNFTVKKASVERKAEIRLFGGYNSLQKELGQPRANFSISDRFLSRKLGAVLTANGQQVNRSSDNLEVNYIPTGTRIATERVTLTDRLETRKRYGASLTLDYVFNPLNTLLFTSNWSNLDRDELRYRSVYNTMVIIATMILESSMRKRHCFQIHYLENIVLVCLH
ncbi:MAG: TonB-dependent receptor plug domain-containing protein [Saprospiraceae bacterium]|nr:TonB-dependent receptor plug domain-containing protein [Saprospiraceae bacterium]